MRYFDLSCQIYSDMPVYPGDPRVTVEQVHQIEKEGWRLSYLKMPSHVGTHVDALSHMDSKGTTIDKIPIERFCGWARQVKLEGKYPAGVNLVFNNGECGEKEVQQILDLAPSFVAFDEKCVLSVEMERKLLKSGIITITDLVNTGNLPNEEVFEIFAFPLKILNGDGSPVRVVARMKNEVK